MAGKDNTQMAEFFIFGYYGYTSKEINDMCPCCRILMCAKRAYLDWNRTIEYEKVASEKDKETFINIGYTILIQGISGILEHKEWYGDWSEKNQAVFDTLHSRICEKIEKAANDQTIDSVPNTYLLKQKGEKRFYYGQAQKWLNMTLKYMELLDLNSVRSIRGLLHVPIDRYILRAAACSQKSRYAGEYSLFKRIAPIKHMGSEMAEKKVYYTDEHAQPWSRLNQKDYKELQKDLRDSIGKKNWEDIKCPLDWEAKAWIEQAQKERKKP